MDDAGFWRRVVTLLKSPSSTGPGSQGRNVQEADSSLWSRLFLGRQLGRSCRRAGVGRVFQCRWHRGSRVHCVRLRWRTGCLPSLWMEATHWLPTLCQPVEAGSHHTEGRGFWIAAHHRRLSFRMSYTVANFVTLNVLCVRPRAGSSLDRF